MTPEKRHEEALRRFEITRLADRWQRELAVEDLLFINAEDGQWEDELITNRKDRPRYTIDRISGALDQIVGDQRQTRTSMLVTPTSEKFEGTARVYTGLIRDIERNSHANNIYDAAFEEALTCGYGGFRILTEFDEATFNQIVALEPINSAASSLYFDPSAKKYDKRDAGWAFLVGRIAMETFKDTYPKAAVVDFSTGDIARGFRSHWFSKDDIQLAEYFYKVSVNREIGLMSDGRILDLGEESPVLDELQAQGVTVARRRTVKSHNIEMVIMNGAEILTKPQKWVGKYIPLVPVFGRTAWVNGVQYIRGKVRKAKDSQRIYNYATSAAVEATALTPKDPIWITTAQAKGHESKLRNFPTQNSPFMFYNPDPAVQGPPSRGGAPVLQQALLSQIAQAATDIHSTTGIEPASLGNVPNLRSGKAIRTEQEMGDRGSYVYQSNFEKSLAYAGEILVDLIPRIYDSERVVKVLGPDGVEKDVKINESVVDEDTLEPTIVNDLSQGSYSVVAKSGPSFSTQRESTVAKLMSLAENNPLIGELALDLVIDNMDLNNGDEIKSRVRKRMIDQGLVQPTEEEKKQFGLDKPPPPDPMQEQLIANLAAQTEKLQIDSEKIIAEIKNKDADTQSKIIAAQKDSVQALTLMMETMLKKMDANVSLTEEDMYLVEGQKALVEETQEDVLEGQEIAGSKPMGLKGQQVQPGEPESMEAPPGMGAPTGPTGPRGPNLGPRLPDNLTVGK